jgi:UDP-N-acetylmuramoyl-tripeptide--D-alanyl-D-alanine ligase
VPQYTPQTLADWTGGQWTRELEAAVTGFTMDTRQLKAGMLFVALRTERRDGHDFLDAARTAGASAALVSAADPAVDLPQLVVTDPLVAWQAIARENRRRFPGPVIGVTGSVGKTSTKDMLAAVLGPRVLATTGNLNNHLGVPLMLTQLDSDQHDYAVIEAGISAPGEMEVLAGMIEPTDVIVTQVDHAHTEGLGGLDGVAREKAKLAAAVPPDGNMIFPIHLLAWPAFAELPERTVVVEQVEMLPAPTSTAAAQFMVSPDDEQTVLSVVWGRDRVETYTLARTTEGMGRNAALVVTVARRLGFNFDQVQAGLAAWQPAAMRGEVRHESERFIYLDCYNANPCSMADALETFQLRADEEAPRLYLLGGMEELGEESARQHHALGASLNLRAPDHLLVIGTGAEQVQAGALEAGARPEQIEVLTNLEGVATQVAAWPGAIFIKGSRRYRLETVLAGEAAATR